MKAAFELFLSIEYFPAGPAVLEELCRVAINTCDSILIVFGSRLVFCFSALISELVRCYSECAPSRLEPESGTTVQGLIFAPLGTRSLLRAGRAVRH